MTSSCFLPGTNIQYALDSTSLGYLKTCPRLYQYIMVDGWTSNEESIHLRFGIEYHQALHDYELAKANGNNHDDAMQLALGNLTQRLETYPETDPTAKPSIRNKSREALLRTVIWYLDKFADDPAETVILDDGKPALEVSFKFELDWGPMTGEYIEAKCVNGHDKCNGSPTLGCPYCETTAKQPYLLCGHLDRIVRYNSELFVMDRKTTTMTLGDYYFAQFEPNNQMTLYTIAGKVVLGTTIRGVIIDAAQVLVSESKFQRSFTYRTEDGLQEWLHSLKSLLAQAEQYATENFWPMNDTACDKFGGCRFRDVCSKSPRVRENFLKGSFKQLPKEERWNPLMPR
jgi:hypothetical protein